MSGQAPPAIKRPNKLYIERLRAAELAKKTGASSSATPQARDFGGSMPSDGKVALSINGGGILPVAVCYGLFRGFHKGGKGSDVSGVYPNFLDRFDYIAGVSGGMIASATYTFAQCQSPATLLDVGRARDPCTITKADLSKMCKPKKGETDAEGLYGYVCTGPGLLWPLSLCLPNACWLLIALFYGGFNRLLCCGMRAGGYCFPFAIGLPAAWIAFMYNYFLKPVGVIKDKYMAPTEADAEALAAERGITKDQFVWPRPGAPVPMGHFVMAEPANLNVRNDEKPFAKWVKAATAKAMGKYAEGVPSVGALVEGRDGVCRGELVAAALEEREKGGGVCIVPWSATPGTAWTPYLATTEPAPGFPADSSYGPEAFTFKSRQLDLCCRIPKPIRYNAIPPEYQLGPHKSVYTIDFARKPKCHLFGRPPGDNKLSIETLVATSGDAAGGGSAVFGPCFRPCTNFDTVFQIRTAAKDDPSEAGEKEAMTMFTDGGVIENTGVAGTVARGGFRKIVAVVTGEPFGSAEHTAQSMYLFDPDHPDQIDSKKMAQVGALFGVHWYQTGRCDMESRPAARVILNQIFNNDARDVPKATANLKLTPWEELIQGLDGMQAEGCPLVYTLRNLETVDNPFWGIKAGDLVDLTVLSFALPSSWKKMIAGNKELNPDNLSADDLFGKKGPKPFGEFPYNLSAFPTTAYSPEQVNLCGYLGDWIIEQVWDAYTVCIDGVIVNQPGLGYLF